ncbi:MAG TPA: NUDIX hydrolase [Dehalococcoidia bacterium]|nr:NUDIX hydrolase [Dehalococcoidia bacterium]
MSPERLSTPVYCQRCGHPLVERYVAHEGRTRYQCEACGFIHYMNPRVVAATIVEHEGRLLLQQRAIDPGRGTWTFPGGFLEVGERPEDGAVRETKEEVGLDVTLRALLGVYSRPHVGIVLVVYESTSPSAAAYVADAESLDVRWFDLGDIPWDELAFDTTAAALRDWTARHAPDAR